ncbi:alpha-sarcoglycan-like isoform X2 [Montipora capricornis]|uniref:alpha-sarcoglycan-like isoform X2 n=1 Tax=Montipora capricornis TaxID=246305 RepID=UPI0035F14DC0
MTLKILILFGFLFCCIQLSSEANITANATTGIFLQKELSVSNFFPSDSGQSEVKFIASKLGSPDLPPWLRLEQREVTDRAFIYGTPGRDVTSQVVLEITAWNKKDYSTERQDIVISVDNTKEIPRYQAEFLVRNSSIDEFLEGQESAGFVEKVKKLWQPAGGVKVTSVESKLDRDGRVPIPPQKEGVYITVGGESTYEVLKMNYQGCSGLGQPANKQFPPYDIDWCKFRLMDKSQTSASASNDSKPAHSGEGFHESTYVAPVYDSSRRDFGHDFLLILILPLIVVLIIAIILAVIMFCFREGRPKRDAETARPQLSHHATILRATFRLRQLSHQNGDTPHEGPPHDLGQPKESSIPYKQFPPPDQREEQPEPPRGAPPPYRLPPQPGVNLSSANGNSQYYPGSAQGHHFQV